MIARLHRSLKLLPGLLLLLAACGDSPVGPEEIDDPIDDGMVDEPEVRTPDPVAGKSAFEASCAGCHASGNGFDLAYFSFSDFDIVRRAVAHVDTSTAEDIVAFIRSLAVDGVAEETPPFQPGTELLTGDLAFWRTVFGTNGWPDDLTPSALREIEPRTLSVPLKLPTWSSENDELDWMPEVPLPNDLLSLEGGILVASIENYRSNPDEARLVDALRTFRRLTTSAGGLCQGEAAVHVYATECFEARRWMSSLAATYYLSTGSEPTAFETAQAWWDTGEAAVSIWAQSNNSLEARRASAMWLYLGFANAPEGFAERSGYLGQHLQTLGMPRLATFTALRRMVGDGPAHQEADQRFWDASLAVTRSPASLVLEVARFSYTYLRDRLASGSPADDLEFASITLRQSWQLVQSKAPASSNRVLRDEVAALYEELTALLQE